MNITIKALGIEPFSISNEIPEGLSGYYIPGTKVLCAVATFGKFMIQLVDLGEYSWLYYIFIIKEEITFLLTYSAPLILVRIILKGNFSYEIESLGNVPLGENQCNIIFIPTAVNKLHFQPGEHILFEALCNPPSMLQALLRFPMFEDFKANITAYKPALLYMPHIKPSASVIECIYKIIHSPFSENARQFHINSIKDLLIHILKAASRSKPLNTRFTVDELERIYAAQAFIDKHLPTHYSISHIARHVGMNEKKLKYGFKEVIGIGLYGYFLNRILEIAKIEIEQTKRSVKQIAQHTGYKNGNNLSAAFRKKFGMSPLEWRRKFDSKGNEHFE